MRRYIRRIFQLGFTLILFCNPAWGQYLQINEIMTSNISVLPDEDGEYPDWFEIYNPTDSVVHLDGMTVTDDTLVPGKWAFPEMSIPAGEYLLVHCSGKDRFPNDNLYETLIRRGDAWQYRIGDSEPAGDWNTVGFDDSGWESGISGFGYGDGDDNTEVNLPELEVLSLYVRKSFQIDDTSKVISTLLHVDFDDAFVAYLNGTEIARSHIGEVGTPPAFDEESDLHEAVMYSGQQPDEFLIEKTDLLEGENVLAIQVHNNSPGSSDLTLIPFLTLVLSQAPDTPLGPSPELNFPGSRLHTSFKLSAGGESLVLADAAGGIIDSVSFGSMPSDVSWGKDPSGGEWYYYQDPTPGAANDTPGVLEAVDQEVSFFPEAGFFDGSMSLSLGHSYPDGMIRYTTDGSEPGQNDEEYTGTINLNTTTVIRARIFSEGSLPGKTTTHTFVDLDDIDADNIPIVSISTDPDNLYDEQDGLFLNAENRELEKPMHVEFIEPDGRIGFSIDAGLKIFGNEPGGGYHQHKLSIFARSKYGYGNIDYQIFKDKPIQEFESVVLRNGINETHDVIASRLVDDKAVAKQSYRPTIVFINGEYWGTKFMREKINEHFVAENFGVHPDSVDVLMGIESPVEYYNEDWPIAGDLEDYKELVHYLIDNSMADSSNYVYIKTQIDIHNYITYQSTEIFYGNHDWPGNNAKWWRERKEPGPWRWILFDVDAGMGAWDGPSYNCLAQATDSTDVNSQWPNPLWSTFVFRKLLKNQSFRDQYVMRSMDLMNTFFTEERVNAEMDILVAEVEAEIRNHCRRWEGSYGGWEDEVEDIRNWAGRRPSYVRNHIKDYFELGEHNEIDLDVDPPGAGKIQANSVLIESFPWEGRYFEDLPVTLEAIPAYGYTFSGWEGARDDTVTGISVDMLDSPDLTAKFNKEDWYEPVVINEINYNSSPEADSEDWVELYNNGTETVDLTNWILKDADDAHTFSFPAFLTLEPGEYLVVCRAKNLFNTVYPGVENVIGGMSFGLSGMGDSVRLFNNNMVLTDLVAYDDIAPWPEDADGYGGTLSLHDPDLDNNQAHNWFSYSDEGTPGRANDLISHMNSPEVPDALQISDPWPNPFRMETTIRYSLDANEQVRIAIFDMQGRLVEELVNEKALAGSREVTWNAHSQDPGIYFCVIRTGSYSLTKKLILLK